MEAFQVALWGAYTPSHFAAQPHPWKALRKGLLERNHKSGGEFKVLGPELLGTSLLTASLCSQPDKLGG